nr:reverse transcriptase domain-containing protein [Tanacetum cinerariifolium]
MIKESVEVFMDYFFVFGSSFDNSLNNLDKMLQRCKDAHLVLNLKKCHFMVIEGIVLGHKVSEAGLKVNKAKIKVISKLPPPLISKEFLPRIMVSKSMVLLVMSAPAPKKYLGLIVHFELPANPFKGIPYGDPDEELKEDPKEDSKEDMGEEPNEEPKEASK